MSNVVNDRGGFSEETRSKVLQVIAETGYKPNRAARQLRTNRARHIGFPLHTGHVDPRNPFTLLFLKAVADAVKPLGHSLIVFACGDDDEETFRSWARSGEIDGFVFDRVAPGDYRTAVAVPSDPGPAAARSTASSSTGSCPATTARPRAPSWGSRSR